MKKVLFLFFLFVCISFTVFSQGFYLDVGGGLGFAETEVDGVKMNDLFELALGPIAEVVPFGLEASLKAGYGPFSSFPLFFVGEVGGIFNVYIFSPKKGYGTKNESLTYNHLFIAPGVIFYPIPLIQLGFSFGYTLAGSSTSTDLKVAMGGEQPDAKGFGLDVSLAFDFGQNRNGLLLGVKYFFAKMKTDTTPSVDQKLYYIGIFIKYAFRNKPVSLF